MIWDWIRFIACVALLVACFTVLIMEIRECRARGGVLVQYSCVQKI